MNYITQINAHCGDKRFESFDGMEGQANFRYLAKITGPSISISSTYILFITEMQKKQTLEKGFALFKKRYHRYFRPLIFTLS
jgi:hypothetical protein